MNNKTPKIILIIFLSLLVIGLSVFFVNILTNKDFRFGHFLDLDTLVLDIK